MNKRARPLKSSYQINKEQVRFLLEHTERNLEEYKKAIEITAEAKNTERHKNLLGFYCERENRQLKEYIANIKKI